MKVKFVFVLLILFLSACDKAKQEKPIDEQIRQANVELDKKNLSKTIEMTVHIKEIDPKNYQASYISAQAYSLSGDVEKSMKELEDALEEGFKNFDDLKKNKNLKELRSSPVFEVVVKKYEPTFSIYSEVDAGDASIKHIDGKQVIKAGDVSITIPDDE